MSPERIQTMCDVLASQRNSALDVVAQQQGEIADYRARIAALEAKVVTLQEMLPKPEKAPEPPAGEGAS